MPSMASSIHSDFRDDVTKEEAEAVDRETGRLIEAQQQARVIGDMKTYIELGHKSLENTLRAYKAGSPQEGGSWSLIGYGYLKGGMLTEAKEATEKAIEIYNAIETESARNNIALIREQLGSIFEELGQMADAREIRL